MTADTIPARVEAPSARRPWTPDETGPDGWQSAILKRACNGCDALIGDVTETELDAIVDGLPLPDVRDECPVCTPWTGTKELEPAWAPVLHFNERYHKVPAFPEIRYRVPHSTMDPRWEACRKHHPACDCREAELNEQIRELAHDARGRDVLAEHLQSIADLHRPGKHGLCRVCFVRSCPTRSLAIAALRAAGAWWDGDEE